MQRTPVPLVSLTRDLDERRAGHRRLGVNRIAERMRAAENWRWILRAANDGITATIDPAGRVVERGTHRDLVMAGGYYAGLWWDELMNDRPPVEPRSPSPEGLSAVLNEGSDTP